MKRNTYILILISIGFVIGIIIFLATNNRGGDQNGWQSIQINSSDNATNTIQEQSTSSNNMTNENKEPLDIQVLKEGTGPEIKNGDTATVHYTGTFENGTKFDSSVDRGTPFSFTLGAGQVIKGWDLGILGMKVGEKRKLTIQPEYGYGPKDYMSIPGNSVLIFEVELLKIN